MAPPRLAYLSLRQLSKNSTGLTATVPISSAIRPDSTPITPLIRPSSSSSNVSSFHTTCSFAAPRTDRSDDHVLRLIRNVEKNRRSGSKSVDQGAQHLPSASNTIEQIQKHALSVDLSKQITRRWKAGDVYAPHDLSGVEMRKWKERAQPTHDVFDVLDFDPMVNYKNFSIMSEYMTPMGRIKKSQETGLRPKNQRKIARAIRRSIGLGLMPSVYRHPEILKRTKQRSVQSSPYKNSFLG